MGGRSAGTASSRSEFFILSSFLKPCGDGAEADGKRFRRENSNRPLDLEAASPTQVRPKIETDELKTDTSPPPGA